MYSKELLKGTLKPIILQLLSQTERMYGYEIVRAVKERSDNKIVIKEGTLYPLLHSLAEEGALETEVVMIGKRLRKYYSLSGSGKALTKNKLAELNDFMQTIHQIIKPKSKGYAFN